MTKDATDFELLDAWAAGDREAGDALLSAHFEAVYRFFRNKVDGELHDLVQDAFLRCTEAAQSFRREAGFRAFLFGVARRVLYDHLRRHYRGEGRVELGSVSVMDLGTSPSALVAREQEHRVLLHALRTLPLDDQIALELAYWEELSGPEIAAVMDVPPATARTRLHRARLALRKQVEALAGSPEVVQSTLDNLERWAGSVREMLAADGRG